MIIIKFVKKILKKIGIKKTLLSDFNLLILFWVGYIPIHILRKTYYKISGVKIGKNSSFHWRTQFFCPSGISVGENTLIGANAFLDGRNKIVIGNNVNLSMDVSIWTEQHDYNDANFGTIGDKVVIEDYCWISHRSIILPGVKIGKGSVVAAGSVVTRDIEPYSVVGGIPAKKIADRSRDLTYTLKYHKPFQ